MRTHEAFGTALLVTLAVGAAIGLRALTHQREVQPPSAPRLAAVKVQAPLVKTRQVAPAARAVSKVAVPEKLASAVAKRPKPRAPRPLEPKAAAEPSIAATADPLGPSDPLATLPAQPPATTNTTPLDGAVAAEAPLLGNAASSPAPQAPEVLAQYVSSQYPDIQPNGSTALLLVLLDSSGTVVNVKIAIPSENTLQDLTLSMGLRNTKFTNIEPPLAAGEFRWVELRFDYGHKKELIP